MIFEFVLAPPQKPNPGYALACASIRLASSFPFFHRTGCRANHGTLREMLDDVLRAQHPRVFVPIVVQYLLLLPGGRSVVFPGSKPTTAFTTTIHAHLY